ncbi:MAG: two-component regulator propeller domain-containing protein [Bacteroidota bacterium]
MRPALVFILWNLCVYLLSGGKLCAQKTELYHHYTISEGLPSSVVYCAFQDDYGRMWFGTSAGVSRYNGKHFTNFDQSDGLTSPFVYQLKQDSYGRIWALSGSGKPCFFLDGSWHNASDLPELDVQCNKGYISALVEMHPKEIMLSCNDRGLIRIGASKSQNINDKEDSFNRVVYIVPYKRNRLLAILQSQIVCFNTETQDTEWRYTTPYIHRANKVGADQIMAFGRDSAMIFSISERKLVEEYKVKLASGTIFIGPQTNKGIILGTREGLYYFNQGKYTPHPLNRQLKDLAVSWYIEDEDNGVWVTTLESGVFYFPETAVKNPQALSNTDMPALTLALMPDSSLFVGSEIGKYYFSQNGQMMVDSLSEELIHTKVHNIVLPKNSIDEYCIASETGLKFFKDGKSKYTHLACRDVIYDATSDRLFISQLQGVVSLRYSALLDKVFDPTTPFNDVTAFSDSSDIICFKKRFKGSIYDLHQTNDRAVWMGGVNGIYKYNIDQNHFYDYSDSFPEIDQTPIRRINELNKQWLVLGTYGRGILLDNQLSGKSILIDDKSGLSNNYCRDLFVENDHSLWVVHLNGISHIDLEDPSQPLVYNFGVEDGLPDQEIYCIRKYDGQFWLGSVDGIHVFDNAEMLRKRIRPRVRIPAITYDKKKVQLDERIQIPYSSKIKPLTFTLECNSFIYGQNISYAYRLKGVQNQWENSTTEQISYSNLPAGKYQFEYKAVHPLGVESLPTNVAFEVILPFYRTSWFQLLVLMLFGLGLVLLFRAEVLTFDKTHLVRFLKKLIGQADNVQEITIKTSDGIFVKLPSNEVYTIQAAGNYVQFFTARGSFLSRNTLKEVESELEKIADIEKVHRSYLVNLSLIEAIRPNGIQIKDKLIPVSSSYQEKLNAFKHKIHAS